MNITARCRESVLSALFVFVGSERLWRECVLVSEWAGARGRAERMNVVREQTGVRLSAP